MSLKYYKFPSSPFYYPQASSNISLINLLSHYRFIHFAKYHGSKITKGCSDIVVHSCVFGSVGSDRASSVATNTWIVPISWTWGTSSANNAMFFISCKHTRVSNGSLWLIYQWPLRHYRVCLLQGHN